MEELPELRRPELGRLAERTLLIGRICVIAEGMLNRLLVDRDH